jgi:hypothetical protein
MPQPRHARRSAGVVFSIGLARALRRHRRTPLPCQLILRDRQKGMDALLVEPVPPNDGKRWRAVDARMRQLGYAPDALIEVQRLGADLGDTPVSSKCSRSLIRPQVVNGQLST